MVSRESFAADPTIGSADLFTVCLLSKRVGIFTSSIPNNSLCETFFFHYTLC